MSCNELKVRIHQLETEHMRPKTAKQKLMTVESKLREARTKLFQPQYAVGSVKMQDEAFEKMNGERIELKKKNREKHEMIGEMVQVKKEMEKITMEEAKDEKIMQLKKELEKMRMDEMEDTTAESSKDGPSISQHENMDIKNQYYFYFFY
ncbi:unnamed protein product [Caenorhabditis brenneri]